ncbi:MAG TPA: phage baseplate assembly protein V [Opitutaceae bacterium]|nr:phage baseplate assembly protein V [Opitutaceae bacterium]
MKPKRRTTASRQPFVAGPQWSGLASARVTAVTDPEGLGRVKIELNAPGAPGGAVYEGWARLATLMAGPKSGTWFVPDVNDEVLVAFDSGDSRQPYVIGSLWNNQNPPPQSMDPGGANTVKLLRSARGMTVTLDDRVGQGKVTVQTPGGQRIALTDGPAAIQIIDANGNAVSLGATGITINAAAKVMINAAEVDVSAGVVQVNAGMSRFSGVLQCDTLIAKSVVSASYSPGVGNVM